MTDAPSDRGSLTRDGTWSEPQRDWLPIARAVFCFAIAHMYGQRSVETHQDDSDPFSIEAFEKLKSRQDNTSADVVGNETNSLSLHNLRRILSETAGTRQAEIDLEKGYFQFGYDFHGGGAGGIAGAPWLLAIPSVSVEIDTRIELEALFKKENGLALIRDEEAKQNAQQIDAMRVATDLVWNQMMLPAFDRSVSAGRIRVYARVHSRLAHFQRLPGDLWSRLEVEDWPHGTARDPEGNSYYSVHAADSLPKISPTQASTVAVETAATNALTEELKRNHSLTREQAYNWCEANGHQMTKRGFLNRVLPKARSKAGLPPLAPPGRPKKSTH